MMFGNIHGLQMSSVCKSLLNSEYSELLIANPFHWIPFVCIGQHSISVVQYTQTESNGMDWHAKTNGRLVPLVPLVQMEK